ncbi:MAG: iron ABC transporter permease [Pseudomonadota bacterium]
MSRFAALTLGLGALLVLAVIASLASGPLAVSPDDLIKALLGSGPPDAETALALRGPRVATAVLTGAALAGAGAAFQILFRNPLVAPDLLGVSSGAGLGAALALIAGGSALMIQGSAFAGGLAAAALALTCAAAARGHEPRLSLVLCGLVTGALASAGLSLAVVLAEPYSQLPALTYWLLGAFSRATAGEVALGAVPITLGVATLLCLGFRLDVLSLGDEQARSLGLPAPRLRLLAVVAASLMTSSAVALTGVVGWIGLLAPHAARLVVGPQASRLLPASLLTGALFALAVDRLTTAFGPAELPVGLVAAALGAPAFLALFVMTGLRA